MAIHRRIAVRRKTEPSVGLSKKTCRTAYNIIEYSIDNIPQHRSERSQNKRRRICKERLQIIGATDRYVKKNSQKFIHHKWE